MKSAIRPTNPPNYTPPSNVIDSAEEPAPLTRRPTYAEVSARAHQLWQQSGEVHDHHLEHWREAEHQLEVELAAQGGDLSTDKKADPDSSDRREKP